MSNFTCAKFNANELPSTYLEAFFGFFLILRFSDRIIRVRCRNFWPKLSTLRHQSQVRRESKTPLLLSCNSIKNKRKERESASESLLVSLSPSSSFFKLESRASIKGYTNNVRRVFSPYHRPPFRNPTTFFMLCATFMKMYV